MKKKQKRTDRKLYFKYNHILKELDTSHFKNFTTISVNDFELLIHFIGVKIAKKKDITR